MQPQVSVGDFGQFAAHASNLSRILRAYACPFIVSRETFLFGILVSVKKSVGSTKRGKEPVPWYLWLTLAASIYIFWILPHQLPRAPVKPDFLPIDGTPR